MTRLGIPVTGPLNELEVRSFFAAPLDASSSTSRFARLTDHNEWASKAVTGAASWASGGVARGRFTNLLY